MVKNIENLHENTKVSSDTIVPEIIYTKLGKIILGSFLLVILMIYVSTLYPHFAGGDRYWKRIYFILSGELIEQAYNFDVGHPPGYPLLMIILFIATHIIPFGSIGWRANLTASCI